MPMMPGKSALLELLKQEGVRILFGNPGTTELPLMDALAAEQDLRYVLALQEAPAMGMADGYAQASGQCAFVNLHAAPGLGNAMGMLYDAQKGDAPILVTAGQHEQRFNFTEPLLWADLPRIARPFVKWSEEVRRLEDLPRAIHRAVKTALAPPMGPVFLSLPGDILTASADLDLGRPSRVGTGIRGDASMIAAGGGDHRGGGKPRLSSPAIAVPQSNALAELVALAEALGAPVYDEGMATRAMFPSSHPPVSGRYRPPAGGDPRHARSARPAGVDRCRPVHPVAAGRHRERCRKSMPIVHLDTDAWELGKNYPEKVSILGDPKVTLPELTAAIKAARSAQQAEKAAKRLMHAMSEGESQPAKAARHGRCDVGTESDPSAGADADDRAHAAGRRSGDR